MNHPSLEERRKFWLRHYSQECFQTVMKGCEYSLRNAESIDERVFRVLSAGLIATYAKPFTKCHGVGCMDEKLIPVKYLKVHRNLMDLRHKTVAHLDALNFHADETEIGNLNQIRLKSTKFGYEIIGFVLPLNILEIQEMKTLVAILIEKTAYQLDKFTKRYVTINPLKPGEYIVNIDPHKPELFLPTKPIAEIIKVTGPVSS